MRIVSIVLRVLVGLVFTAQGVMKLSGAQNEWRDDLQVEPWFWILIGIVQLAGAIGLFASLSIEKLTIPSGLLFVVVMLGALATHIRVSDPVSEMIAPALLLLMSAAIATMIWRRNREDEDPVSARQEATWA